MQTLEAPAVEEGFRINPFAWGVGTHYVRAEAKDIFGKTGTSQLRQIHIDYESGPIEWNALSLTTGTSDLEIRFSSLESPWISKVKIMRVSQCLGVCDLFGLESITIGTVSYMVHRSWELSSTDPWVVTESLQDLGTGTVTYVAEVYDLGGYSAGWAFDSTELVSP